MNEFADVVEMHLRGVEGAAPYNKLFDKQEFLGVLDRCTILASLPEGGGTALAVTEGVSYCMSDTPPVSFADSPLKKGAGNRARRDKQTDK